ncbi:TetR/AcrR family transcriptional regulator [Georgenia halophila]|uniref:TetR/AcrR family transcriptional regulator n=1 Tax=Georgenia halophila TaxID=620889 RepID=A0ABP8LER2_9MICO
MTSGTRAQQRDTTRQTLVDEARRLFAGRGYGEVGLSAVVEAAGVTKGALYHHFDGKAQLFRAVLAQVQAEVGDAVEVAAASRTDAWGQLVEGCGAFLVAATDAEVRQIMLVDGPAVLGWEGWRALDEANSARHLHDVLTALVEDGTIAQQPVEPLTHLLSGAMNEAALWVAGTGRGADLDASRAALLRLLEGLRAR